MLSDAKGNYRTEQTDKKVGRLLKKELRLVTNKEKQKDFPERRSLFLCNLRRKQECGAYN